MTASSGTSDQVIALPKGGGALSGIGERYASNLQMGTGSFRIPIAVPLGRNGFQPELVLEYGSTAGQGPFGHGWSLPVSKVSRKTSKGVPGYDNDTDCFVLAGAEDLVPVERAAGFTRYRPRSEILFARIVHFHTLTDDHWEIHGRDGVRWVYGIPESRGADATVVADPTAPRRIFAWPLTRTEDPFGNVIEYRYMTEQVVESAQAWTQSYLSEIRYVDHDAGFLNWVSLDYAERPDPFSDRRAGFQIKTRWRCREIGVRVQAERDYDVRSYRLTYADEHDAAPANGMSLLSTVQLVGYDDDGTPYDGAVHGGRTRSPQMPPLEFGYTCFAPDRRSLRRVRGAELPARSLVDPVLQFVDLRGNGLPDIVEVNGHARWWRNLGDGCFDSPRTLDVVPSGTNFAQPGVELIDADGDGRIDVLETKDGRAGFFPLRVEEHVVRDPLRRVTYAPSFDLDDPQVKLVDVDGDGVIDAVRSGTVLDVFFNHPRTGWDPHRRLRTRLPLDVSFTDPRVHWADMTGDRLQDVVLVHDGSIEYAPNLGHGRWGAAVAMRHAPRLPYGYDPQRVLLGDVDGDGTADLVYVGDGRVFVWLNQTGESWSEATVVEGTPAVTGGDTIRLEDLLGTGMRGVLWSSREQGGVPRMTFLDLTGAVKPYLLEEVDNHLGTITRIAYTSSTIFQLEKCAPTPTSCPMPVPVVSSVRTDDLISGSSRTQEFRYRHPHWDGADHEFRGFAMVEERDRATAVATERPPVLTRTWFHIGPVGEEEGEWAELDLAPEQWAGDPSLVERPNATRRLLNGLPRRVRRDAVRALRGLVLRAEVYVLDGTDRQARPFSVTEAAYGIAAVVDGPGGETRLDADAVGTDPVFFPHIVAERVTEWERGDDPLTRFTFTDDYDAYGQPRRVTTIACPRGWRRLGDAPEAEMLATRTRTDFVTERPADVHIVDRIARTTTWELRDTSGCTVAAVAGRPDDDPRLEIIHQAVVFYDRSSLPGARDAFRGLPWGQLGRYGAEVRRESLVLTEPILETAYGAAPPPYLTGQSPPAEYPAGYLGALPPAAGYVRRDGSDGHAAGWFAVVESRRYDFHDDPAGRGRGLVLATRDPMSGESRTTYDAFALLPVEHTLLTGVGEPLVRRAVHNYRVLRPARVTDPNGNHVDATYSPLGLISELWVRGREDPGRPEGDREAPSIAFAYDLLAFAREGEPVFVRTVRRVHHDTSTDIPAAAREETIETREYSDGFGRLLQARTQAEAERFGDPLTGDPVLTGAAASVTTADAVVVSGWQVHDDRGLVVERSEPFFSTGWTYRRAPGGLQLVRFTYDARQRLVRTVHADGSEDRTVYGVPDDLAEPDRFTPTPWEIYSYDPNDLAPLSTAPDGRVLAANAPREHHFTPTSIELDALRREVQRVERNGHDPRDWHVTRAAYDIRGNLLTRTDTLGRVALSQSYDLHDRRLRVASIDAGVETTVLDAAGNSIETRDRRGRLTLRSLDALHRVVHVWARDAEGEPVTLRERVIHGDAIGAAVNADQNLRGRVYRHYDEAGLVEFRRYDCRGEVLEKARRTVPDEWLLAPFDAPPPDWRVQTFRTDWDAQDSAALEPPLIVSLSYDALGRPVQVTYPAGPDGSCTMRPRYNRAGLLTGVEVDGTPYVRHVAYNARGARVLIAYGNGILRRWSYDPRTLLLRSTRTESYAETAPLRFEPRGGVLEDLSYMYDLAGNLVWMTNRARGCGTALRPDELRRDFTYDPLYRLLTATGRASAAGPMAPWGRGDLPDDPVRARDYRERYRHDPAGNMIWMRRAGGVGPMTSEFIIDPDSNRLTHWRAGSTTRNYGYDAAGNLTRETSSRHFEWDHQHRLRAFRTQTAGAAPTKHATYLYDATGQRVKKLVRRSATNWSVTVYIDGLFEMHRLQRANRVWTSSCAHVIDGQQRIVELHGGDALPGDGAPELRVRYILGDHLGSSTIVVGGADATSAGSVRREEFTPFGVTSFGGFARKRYRFIGKERDEESGLAYHGGRYYAAWIARWTSVDSAARPDGDSPYAYVHGSPLTLRDPDGARATGAFLTGTAGTGETAVGLVGGEGAAGGGTAVAGATTATGVTVGAVVASVAIVAAAVAGLFTFYIFAIMRSGERHDERARRSAIADNLRQDGQMTDAEATHYILTGQLYMGNPHAKERTARDAYRDTYFDFGGQFERHVEATRLKTLIERGQVERQEKIAALTGPRGSDRVIPDWARRDPRVPGAYAYIADAKAGRIELDAQMRGLIDEATRTTRRLLVIFVPDETVEIPDTVSEAAAQAGVRVVAIVAPWSPGWVPKPPPPKTASAPNAAPTAKAGAK